MRVTTIVGARPQFVKAAVVTRELKHAGVDEALVHTGQHYDAEMSAVFFEELGIPEPAVNLEVGSGSHAVQTGEMMMRLEKVLLGADRPDWVLVYGDTNSTLAAALVASKLHIPLAHVEAGLRSFNRRMPEEINRVAADAISDALFCPTATAVENLKKEGITRGVHLTGDVMLDAAVLFGEIAERRASGDRRRDYYLATIHRAENTEQRDRLEGIFAGLGQLDQSVIVPLHPRTQQRLNGLTIPENVEIRPPAGYLDMLHLVRHARAVLTDSGGLQKEALWLETPCITLRDETEWLETLERGWNQLAGADPQRIVAAAARRPEPPVPAFSEPGAAARIVDVLISATRSSGQIRTS